MKFWTSKCAMRSVHYAWEAWRHGEITASKAMAGLAL